MPVGVYKRTKPVWNKGLRGVYKLTDEHKENISIALTGKKKSKEHARKISAAKAGVPRSPECIEKMRAAMKGRRVSQTTEFKKGFTPWNKGIPGLKGPAAYNWRGGRVKDSTGYILISLPGHPNASPAGYVYEHRLVVEKAIGRTLNKKEEVHHINKQKDDNRLSNLMAFASKSDHLKFEAGSMVTGTAIVFDGRRISCGGDRGGC